MRECLAKQDWLRIILVVAFSGYLFHQIYTKTEMLLRWEMKFTEKTLDSEEMKFPSITFCPGSMNLEINNEVDNITADYQNLSSTMDMLISVRQPLQINKYA